MTFKKQLSELSTEELGKLFPIQIVPYDQNWNELFKSECQIINNLLGTKIALKIEHFGSTAVEGLSAKPIIDILIEIPPLTDFLKELIIEKLESIDYQYIWRTDDEVPYMNFVKGYTIEGFKGDIFHLHLGDKSHSLWDRIYFRDYLRDNKEIAKEYEKLKIELAGKYKYKRELYTNAKSDFVKRITKIAKMHSKD